MPEVLLIQPPQTQLLQPRAYISLGLAYIGAVLEESGIEVEILNLADEEHPEKRSYPDAEWYGISCVSATYRDTKRIIPNIRNKGIVVLGGAHPSVLPEETLLDAKPDIVMTGEAEYLFRNLVIGKTEPEHIMHAGIIENLDTLPFPARRLYPKEDVVDVTGIHGQDKGVRATTVITSRGCPYNCYFCCKEHLMFRRYRYRTADNVKKELVSLIEDYDVEHVRFVDDEFTLNTSRTVRLMGAIKDLGLTWVCITRADSLTRSLLWHMERAGCVEVHIGVETGSDRLLKLMNKQTTSKVLLKAVNMIKEAGIRVKTYLMMNYPGETERDREKTVEFLREAKPDKFTLSHFTPLPGSAIAEKLGLRTDVWFYPDEDVKYQEYKNRLREAIE